MPGRGKESERAAARWDRTKRAGRIWPCHPPGPRQEKTARVSRGEKQDRTGREGCLWGWVRKTIIRTFEGGRVDAPQGINKRQTTTGYRGIRVGEAKNPGPGEDLDIEIL